MISPNQWNSLLYLKASHFKNPDKLAWTIVRNLDLFIQRVGSRPVILSDWRPYDAARGGKQQHFEGTSIDTTWPGQDPLRIWQEMLASKLFSGLGVYLNNVDAVSFHTDTRTDRTVDDPALWGDFITYPFDPARGKIVRRDQYVGAGLVLEAIKKKGTLPVLMAAALLFLILKSRKKSRRSRKRRRRK